MASEISEITLVFEQSHSLSGANDGDNNGSTGIYSHTPSSQVQTHQTIRMFRRPNNDETLGETNGARMCYPDACKEYECKLKQVRWSALFTACYYSANRFLGFCALTWASTAILGALLSDLSRHDFYAVTILLLLIALRLFVGICFGHYITRKLVRGFHDPTFTVYQHHNVPFSAKTHSDILFAVFRILDQIIQVAITVFNAVFACRRFHAVLVRNQKHKNFPALVGAQKHQQEEFDVQSYSLLIFYGIASLDGLIAFLSVIHCKVLILLYVQSYSLRDYYEEMVCRYMNIFWTGMGNGMLSASDHDFLEFVFRNLAQLYRQNILYRKNNKEFFIRMLYEDLVVYIYYYPQGQGFEACRLALLSNDAYARTAAVDMLCLWAEMDFSLEITRHQKNLSFALAQALQDNIRRTGLTAARCFETLGKKDQWGTLGVRATRSGEMLVHILIELVCMCAYERWELKAYIRALIPVLPLVMQRIGRNDESSCSHEKLNNLRQALRLRISENAVHMFMEKGTIAVVAYAYRIIVDPPQFPARDVDSQLRAVPSHHEILLPEEQAYLYALLIPPTEWNERGGLSMEWKDRVVTPGAPKWPAIPWIARRSSFLLLAFCTVASGLGLFFYFVVTRYFRVSFAAVLLFLVFIHSTLKFHLPVAHS